MATLVTGLFDNRAAAESAIERLVQLGVSRDDVSVMMSEQTRTTHFSDDVAGTSGAGGTKAAEGAGTGAAIGGTLGAIAGAMTLFAGNLFLPGVGLLAAGPLLAGLAGAGAGGIAGTLVGAMVGLGIPQEHAAHYEAGLRSGGILVGAHVADTLADEARRVLGGQGAMQTETYHAPGATSADAPPIGASTMGAATIDASTMDVSSMDAPNTGGRTMSDAMTNDTNDQRVPPEAVEGAHDADGTMGRVAGTGSGAIAGGIVGSAAGPVGTVVGAVAGAMLGHAGGNAAHKVGDDHDDVDVETGSGGELGRNSGAGAGAIAGGIVGSTAGPVGTVAGAVAGGMLGAAGGDAAKDMGEGDNDMTTTSSAAGMPATGAVGTGTLGTGADLTPGNNVPGVQTGGVTTAGQDTRGITEKAADAVTGDRTDDQTGGRVV